MSRSLSSLKEGFLGSFRLAAALCLAVVGVASTFVHAGSAAAVDAARSITHR